MASEYIEYNDASSTITSGGTAQVGLARNVNGSRSTIVFYNISDTMMYISFVGTATTDSLPIPPGSGKSWSAPQCPQQALSVISATTGKKYLLWYA